MYRRGFEAQCAQALRLAALAGDIAGLPGDTTAGAAFGQRGEDFHDAMALLDGQAQADAVDEPLQAYRVVALGLGDQPLGDHAAVVGEGQHDAAVQAFDAQVDPVSGGEGVADLVEGVVHGRCLRMNVCRN